MNHIEFEKIVKNVEGTLPLTENRIVEEHLSGCAECAAKAKKLNHFLAYVRADRSEKVPPALTANLLNIYQPKKIAPKKDSFVSRILATLAFDDWQMALNERLVFSDTRQFLYKTENIDIDLRLHFTDGKCQVSGQVFPNVTNLHVEIFSDEFVEKVSLNRHSEFIFPALKQGIYGLRLNSDECLIEIAELSLVSN